MAAARVEAQAVRKGKASSGRLDMVSAERREVESEPWDATMATGSAGKSLEGSALGSGAGKAAASASGSVQASGWIKAEGSVDWSA